MSIDTREALRQARELDLDLVEVAPQADPPVCRIMDYGKFKYERDVRQKEARKKQSRTGLKEIKFRPKIDPHDYATKKGHVIRFLEAGNKVKITIMFRGREMAHTELGRKILDRLVADLGALGRGGVTAETRGTQHDHGDRPRTSGTSRRSRSSGLGRHGRSPSSNRWRSRSRSPPKHRNRWSHRSRPRSNRPRRPTKGRTTMPKMKTHRAAAKRFRVTRSGKVLHRKATGNHMLTKKTGSRRRRVEGMAEVKATREQKKLKRLLAR